jgi:hypothetical protein
MRRTLLLLGALLTAAAMHAATLSTVRGTVTTDSTPLPGCTVRLESKTLTRLAVSDADGRYGFAGVPTGEYEISFELESLLPAQQRVLVREETVAVPTQELRVEEVPEITFACGRICEDEPPADRFESPQCSDYELNDVLIESAARGDASSLQLLRNRYETAHTYTETHQLARALIGKSDDAKIWDDLMQRAEVAVRFPESGDAPSPEFLAWCAEQNVDPDRYWSAAYGALEVVASDPRSHALLLRALATGQDTLMFPVIFGLAHQHDVDSLPLIDIAISGTEYGHEMLASILAEFRDERADVVAMKYLEDQSDIDQYREMRSAAEDAERQPH